MGFLILDRKISNWDKTGELKTDFEGWKFYKSDGDKSNFIYIQDIKEWIEGDSRPITFSGSYMEDDYEESVEIYDFKEVIGEDKCEFYKVDMFGKRWRVPLSRVVEMITKTYTDNGWDKEEYKCIDEHKILGHNDV
jgi:hypothetical protein